MEITYLNKTYSVQEYIFNNEKKEVDIVMPIWNNVSIANYAIQSIQKFTDNKLYNLWIVDNGSTNTSMLQYINSLILKAKFEKGNINFLKHLSAPQDWGGSENHALALNLTMPLLKSDYVFFMHDDAVPLSNKWLPYMLSKAKEGNTCVGTLTNWEKDGIKYLHCSGVLIERDFILNNEIDFRPNKPHYDTIGMLTLKLVNNNKKYFVMKNSKNNPELKEKHEYNHERGSESFDDELNPIWAHQGRGSTGLDRGNWLRKI